MRSLRTASQYSCLLYSVYLWKPCLVSFQAALQADKLVFLEAICSARSAKNVLAYEFYACFFLSRLHGRIDL